ncbi:hypothetical protein NEFER03_0932 [Nematocida sp. LUAm3]|nr:hypothetical protein NEFER03_0932 [Nematocida sp. LUAm3]KAI5174950.1 hypothetical protein NEFER02_1050 [Nematocida sp. LUAm2]KAI5177451.1 hypothetical protein NEFER01_0701 [Nematocida sp. LUAm1]
MRYLPLIALVSKTISCLGSSDSLVVISGPGISTMSQPSSVCEQMGYKPFLLQARDVPTVMAALKSKGVARAGVAGWNNERIEMVVGANAGDVTPLAVVNRPSSVICLKMGGGSCPAPAPGPAPAPCPAPGPAPAPCAPVCPAPCAPVCPAPCSPCAPVCPAPCPKPTTCIPDPCTRPWEAPRGRAPICVGGDCNNPGLCCIPKKCVPRRKWRPCESPCVTNYSHRRVYIIDELTIACGPFLRIVETRCRPFGIDRVFTFSKFLPPWVPLPFPNILRNASILHKILCEAREKFGACGCVCLFIDHFNNIYIAVDGCFYKVVVRRPCPPFPIFPPFPGPGPIIPPFPIFPPGFNNPCNNPCEERVNCSPCGPITKCRPSRRVDPCGRPCPSDFVFCKLSCEAMIPIRRRGLYAVLFSREFEY